MATYYIDPEAGVNANAGTSFALRKKTFVSLPTLAAGDEVRIIASHAATNPVNGTWVDNTQTITLASALTEAVTPSTAAWTPSANVTSTTTTARKLGATSSSIAVAAGFTTGLAAYQATGALDLSAYTSISLWVRFSLIGSFTFGTAARIVLCSDAAGATPVETIPVAILGQTAATTVPSGNTWYPLLFEKGSALSSSVQSIALYIDTDQGAFTMQVNNVIACQARGHASHIAHGSLVGKNSVGEPEWYPIRGISGTTVTLGGATAEGTTPGRAYRGVSETAPFYCKSTLAGTDALNRVMPTNNGTEAAPVVVSGGWNRTDMSTKTGDTWVGYGNAGFMSANNHGWLTLTDIGLANLTGSGFIGTGAGTGRNLSFVGVVGAAAGAIADLGTSNITGQRFSYGNVVFGNGRVLGPEAGLGGTRVTARRLTGIDTTALSGSSGKDAAPSNLFTATHVGRIDNCAIGCSISTQESLRLLGCTFASNTTDVLLVSSDGRLDLINCSAITAPVPSSSSLLTQTAVGGNPLVNSIHTRAGVSQTQTAVRHTASGAAWQVSPTSATSCTSFSPLSVSLAKVAVSAGSLVTIGCWLRRTNTGITAGLSILPYCIPGVTLEQQSPMIAAANTWEQVFLTFTPTADGVVEVFGYAFGGTTYSAYFDDFTVTQA